MVNRIRTGNPCGFSKFRVGSWVWHTEEGQRTYRPKSCGNNNKGDDNNLKTLNDKKKILVVVEIWGLYGNVSEGIKTC